MDIREIASFYLDLFNGRSDVFAVYHERKDGSSLFYPKCINFGSDLCGLVSGSKIRSSNICRDCEFRSFEPLTPSIIEDHISGKQIIGIYPLLPNGKIRFGAIDFDTKNFDKVREGIEYSRKKGLIPHIFTSKSKGYHIYFFFDSEIDSGEFLELMKPFKEQKIEVFPKQTKAPYLGNLIRTPLIKPWMLHGSTCMVDEDGKVLTPEDTFDEFLKIKKNKFPDNIVETARTIIAPPILDKKRKEPDRGDFDNIIKGCKAVQQIVDKEEDMTHEERVFLLSLAVNVKGGIAKLIEILSKNKDFDGSDRSADITLKSIGYAKGREERPWSCDKIKERGLCPVKGYCLVPHEGISPSPIRFAFMDEVFERPYILSKGFNSYILKFGKFKFDLSEIHHSPKRGWLFNLKISDKNNKIIYWNPFSISNSSARKSVRKAFGEQDFYLESGRFNSLFAGIESIIDEGAAVRRFDRFASNLDGEIGVVLSDKEKKVAEDVLKNKSILFSFKQDTDSLLVGEEEARLLTLICLISSITDKPISVVVKGYSSSGKSYLSTTIMRFVPDMFYKFLTEATAKSFFHLDKEAIRHKIVYIAELPGSDSSDYAIRSIQSENKLVIQLSIKDPKTNDFFVKEKVVEGPVGFLITTTKFRVNPENETRMFSVFTDPSKEQTSKILWFIAGDEDEQIEDEKWKVAFSQLVPYRVKIPYLELVLSRFPLEIRSRRDAQRFKTLISVVTLIHQKNRELKEDKKGKYLEATAADYYISKRIMNDFLSMSIFELSNVEKSILDIIKEKVEVRVEDLVDFGIEKRRLYRILNNLSERGFVQKLKANNRLIRYRLIKTPELFLPSLEEVFSKWKCDESIIYDPISGENFSEIKERESKRIEEESVKKEKMETGEQEVLL